jgi:DNA polymerase-3 subunit delta
MHYFLEAVGNDMSALTNELDKLLSYIGDRTIIEKADIDQICSVQIIGKIFEMIDAISLRKTKQALQMYRDLLVLKEPPMRILFFINKQYLQFYQLKELKSQGMSDKEIGHIAGLSPYIAKKVCKKADTFTLEELERCLKACAEMDYGIKTGEIKDRTAVEVLITAFSAGIYKI